MVWQALPTLYPVRVRHYSLCQPARRDLTRCSVIAILEDNSYLEDERHLIWRKVGLFGAVMHTTAKASACEVESA